MIYRFIDDKGTFVVQNPHKYDLYLPLANRDGTLLSSISPNLGGDIKRDNAYFLTPPASWYIYTLMEEVLGIKFNFGKIILEPKLRPSDFLNERIEAKFTWRGKTVKAIFPRHGRARLAMTE